MSSEAWVEAGCRRGRRMKGSRATWIWRTQRRDPVDGLIEAKHCPYLGDQPYFMGADAWRLSIQVDQHCEGRMTEIGHVLAASEGEALSALAFLVARPTPEAPATADRPDEP